MDCGWLASEICCHWTLMKWLMDEVGGVSLLSPSWDGNGRWEVMMAKGSARDGNLSGEVEWRWMVVIGDDRRWKRRLTDGCDGRG